MNLALWIGYALAALAVIGIAYQLIALVAVWRFFRAREVPLPSAQPVTILKPLHGAEPRLAENLATFLVQNHNGPLQMICGVDGAGDAAIGAVRTLSNDPHTSSSPRKRGPITHAGVLPPTLDQNRAQEVGPRLRGDVGETSVISLSTGPRAPGANAKIGNLIAMLPFAAHDTLILSDSDIVVGPDYLATLLAALDQPGVGAVTCLYAGRADAGVWSAISAAAMRYTGLPNMVMALATGIAQPCLGSTIAIRRETLDAIGGFERFADVLADDYAMGEAIAALGLKVAVPPMLLTHACAHRSLDELWQQHRRWSVTIRGVAPLRHAGAGVTHALAFALLSLPFAPLAGAALTVLALALRVAMARTVDKVADVRGGLIWLLPLADLLEFAAFVASFAARAIDWRGSQLTMTEKGRIAPRNPSATEIS